VKQARLENLLASIRDSTFGCIRPSAPSRWAASRRPARRATAVERGALAQQ